MRLIVLLLVVGIVSAGPLGAAVFNVMDYGAKADGKTDDTAAFNVALSKAAGTPGSTVVAPQGTYLIAGSIDVMFRTTLQGEYHGQCRSEGTVLLATGGKGNLNGPACIVTDGWNVVENIAIEYPEQDPDATEPTQYPWAITVAPCTRVENVMLYNAYQGLLVDQASTCTIRDIWGEPLKTGIRVDQVLSTSSIENVRFYPMFTGGKPLREWVQANGTAFEFGKFERARCTNLMCSGYKTGCRFFRSEKRTAQIPGGVTSGSFVGLGVDSCHCAIDVEDCGPEGLAIANAQLATSNGPDGRAVALRKSNAGSVTLTNCGSWDMSGSFAEVHGGVLNVSACNIGDWGKTRKAVDAKIPCIAADGGRLNVNGCNFNRGGLLATIGGDATRALFAGNMGAEPLTVVGGTLSTVTVSANNPDILHVMGGEEVTPPPSPEPAAKPAPAPKPGPRTRQPIPEMPDH